MQSLKKFDWSKLPAVTGSGPPDEPEQQEYAFKPPRIEMTLERVRAALEAPPPSRAQGRANVICTVCGGPYGSCPGPFFDPDDRFRPF